MIKHIYVDQLECIDEHLRDIDIAGAGGDVPTWMIVGKDHGYGVVMQNSLHHFAWIDRRTVDRALEEFLKGKDLMAVI